MGSPVTERAIPLAIFQSDPSVARHHLRKWLKDPSIHDIDIREILDWQYYIERLGSAIQKIITIPAALQGVPNPVPRVQHPDWLHKRVLEKTDGQKQRKITDIFAAKPMANDEEDEQVSEPDKGTDNVPDIEDIGSGAGPSEHRPVVASVTKRKRTFSEEEHEEAEKERNSLLTDNWRRVLGNPPDPGETRVNY